MRPKLSTDWTPPSTRERGLVRQEQLKLECAKIETQLRQRSTNQSTPVYFDWRRRAQTALQHFRAEEKLLTDWLNKNTPETLLRDAYDLLCILEDEVDLEPEEVALVARLDEYFLKLDSAKGSRP